MIKFKKLRGREIIMLCVLKICASDIRYLIKECKYCEVMHDGVVTKRDSWSNRVNTELGSNKPLDFGQSLW